MCTGTPHCGSGVQAGDELLIPTSSNLAPPFSFLPPPIPPTHPSHPSLPLAALLSTVLLNPGETRGEKKKKKKLKHQPELCFFRWSENSCRQRRAAPAASQTDRTREQAGGRRSCSGQTRSIIDETQATEEEDAARTRFRSGELIVFFSVLLLSHTTET